MLLLCKLQCDHLCNLWVLLDKNGFMKFDSPILSGNAAELTESFFETNYFGTPAYLSQSGQLYLEAVLWPLVAPLTLVQYSVLKNQKLVATLTGIWWWMLSIHIDTWWNTTCNSLCQSSLQGKWTAPQALETWNVIQSSYCRAIRKRITYDQGLIFARAWKWWRCWLRTSEHGDDFGSPHETWVSNHFCTNLCHELSSRRQAFPTWNQFLVTQTCSCADLSPRRLRRNHRWFRKRKTMMPLSLRWNHRAWIVQEYEFHLIFVNTVQYHTDASVSSVW